MVISFLALYYIDAGKKMQYDTKSYHIMSEGNYVYIKRSN